MAQTITYLPHFISVVVLVGMMSCMFSLNSGWVNGVIKQFGGAPVHLMGEAKYFRHVYVWSGVWQGMGWGSIIYLAALTSIDPTLHEAAMIDGCNKYTFKICNADWRICMEKGGNRNRRWKCSNGN